MKKQIQELQHHEAHLAVGPVVVLLDLEPWVVQVLEASLVVGQHVVGAVVEANKAGGLVVVHVGSQVGASRVESRVVVDEEMVVACVACLVVGHTEKQVEEQHPLVLQLLTPFFHLYLCPCLCHDRDVCHVLDLGPDLGHDPCVEFVNLHVLLDLRLVSMS